MQQTTHPPIWSPPVTLVWMQNIHSWRHVEGTLEQLHSLVERHIAVLPFLRRHGTSIRAQQTTQAGARPDCTKSFSKTQALAGWRDTQTVQHGTLSLDSAAKSHEAWRGKQKHEVHKDVVR
jgi:hypothetical protein